NAEDLVLTDEIGDARGDDEGLEPGDAAAADAGEQLLGENADDRRGELRANLVLLVAGEDVDDAVDRAGGATGVERAEHDVARFGGGDGGLDRFQVAHFADEDHVRVLPERAADRLREGGDVDADFALVDRRLLVVVVELDGVFDRDDV